MTILIGDSHTRSYRLSKYFNTRLFLNEGKTQNFCTDQNASISLHYVELINNIFSDKNFSYAYIVGEPDCRKIFYGTFYHDRNPNEVIKKNQIRAELTDELLKQLDKCIHRFEKFIISLNKKPIVIIGPGSPNKEIFNLLFYYNSMLEKVCKSNNIWFFNPMKSSIENNLDFIGTTYKDPTLIDCVHFSSEISYYFDKFVDSNIELKKKFNSENFEFPKKSFRVGSLNFNYIQLFQTHRLC
jgi:hypothetical protein